MATKMAPKQSVAHEKAEAKGLKSGKLSVGGYMAKEKKEGEKPSMKAAMAMKSGKMSPMSYAKMEKAKK
jgi:hypothetical protein